MAVKQPGQQQPTNTAMADALKSAGVTGQQQQEHAQAMNQNQNPGYEQSNTGRRASMLDVGMRSSNRFGRSSAAEEVTRYYNAMREILVNQVGEDSSYKLVLFDGHKNMTNLSAVLLCLHEQVAGVDHVAVHTLLVEASGPALNPRIVNINNQNIEVMLVAGDVFDGYMYGKVEAAVAEAYGRTITVHDAAASVIPLELKVDDLTHLRRVMFNAAAAVYGVLESVLGAKEDRFSLTQVDKNAGMTMARLDYAPGKVESAAGLPIRSDVSVTLQAQENIRGQGQPGQGMEQVRDLAQIHGYVDLVYDPSSSQMNPMAPFGQPQQTTQLYHPRYVITLADTCVDSVDLERILLGLSSAALLSVNNAWAGVYRKRYVQGPDLRDIGAVGYEANLMGTANPADMKRIDTSVDTFGPQQLHQLLSAVMYPGLIYSMDIEEVSDLSWIHLTFIAAASGVTDARQAIIEAADTLTGGHFSRYFPQGALIANDDNNRIHLGYYIDQTTSERRDIRTIDYLAMLNMCGANDLATVVEYADTFDRTDIPLEYRLDRRAKILRNLIGDNLKFKGFARRITFNPEFIMALQAGVHDAGLVIRPSNTIQDFGSAGQRGNPTVGTYAVQGAQAGLFNWAQPSYGQTSRGPGAPLGRWGR